MTELKKTDSQSVAEEAAQTLFDRLDAVARKALDEAADVYLDVKGKRPNRLAIGVAAVMAILDVATREEA